MMLQSVAKRGLVIYPFTPGTGARNACAFDPLRIPMKSAMHSNMMSATCSDLKSATIPK